MAPFDLQPLLFDDVTWTLVEPLPPEDGRPLTLAERFAAFHDANPAVYQVLRKLCLGSARNGMKRWSINGAFEVCRWRMFLETQDPDGWKLNNSYRSYYARLLMANEPELSDFFETRGHHDPEVD